MAYIQPNSTVMLLRGVSIDKNHNHTYYFTSEENQYNFFANKVKPNTQYVKPYGEGQVVNQSFQFGGQTYQRVNKKTIRLAILADYMYDCNYMMFQNTAYGNKWFYAFIDEINYVNDGATEIVYTIDDMQTWYFDYELGQCFVEREHSETDEIGDNLVEENLEIGEYVYNSEISVLSEPDVRYMAGGVVLSLKPAQTFPVSPNFSPAGQAKAPANVGCGVYIYTGFPVDIQTKVDLYPNRAQYELNLDFTLTDIIDAISSGDYDVDSSAIINVFQYPVSFAKKTNLTYGQQLGCAEGTAVGTTTVDRPFYFTGLPVQSIHNNKLFTFPFVKCTVINGQGASADYRFEDFKGENGELNDKATFRWFSITYPEPMLVVYPVRHKDSLFDLEASVPLTNLPSPAYKGDAYGIYLNQQRSSVVMGLIANSINTLGNATIMGASGVGASAVQGGSLITNIARVLTHESELKRTPPNASLGTASSAINIAARKFNILVTARTIKAEFAQIIDNYFNMFGYACHRVKVPNVRNPQAHIRPHWNYIKTQGCIIHPNQNSGLPADSEDRIAQIYDNGITFWSSTDEVGSYNLNNSPTQGE